ncbi:ABC-type Mn/Zn transport system, ATPase component [Rubidibacter lacunae KORDI 51-2]|uniref:ABC-type Mn/Zn transport system, ATPase component n=1 Tax=Rubidibacter lacunae KORDI 51-2 TaxID=582515 RepID=U5DE70_9CHRO|nr:metal ABC transporter ATP-binding protein [Rubidibacter lacunae]ERN39916.1 ABC-type Mn/Zn transport system, ATPase component [Rubidibacter lacunae KORDI 51-2]
MTAANFTERIARNRCEARVQTPASDNSICTERLSVRYRDVEALRDVTCRVRAGRLTGIIGPNGAGKSTLMKAMLGLVRPISGSATLGGHALSLQRERVAYVPQRSQIDWQYPATVWDVVMMGRVQPTGWLRRFSTASRHIARDALERVGMESYRDRAIGALSGGQQQRVFLARALAQQADAFFFDEPFVGVDRVTETVLFSIFRELADAGNIVTVVNHDLGETIAHFDDLILLDRELIAVGERRCVLTEKNLERAYGAKVTFFAEDAA